MIPLVILTIEDEDTRSFMEKLFLQYHKLMCSQALKFLSSSWDVEEVVQIALERLIKKADFLRTLPRDRLIDYIIVTVRNTALRYLQTEYRKNIISLDDEEHAMLDQLASPDAVDDRLIREATMFELHHAWSKLELKHQCVLEWRYILECSTEEIAEKLNIKPSSVRMVLTRARQSLSHELKKLNTPMHS